MDAQDRQIEHYLNSLSDSDDDNDTSTQREDAGLSDIEDHVDIEEEIPTDSDSNEIQDDEQLIGLRQQRRSGVILSSDSEAEESPGVSFNLEQTEPADFDSDDSARDKTFNPRVEEISEESLSSSENIGMYQENASNDVLNTRRKRKGQNLHKTIQIKRNKGQSYETKSGKKIPSRKVTALSDCCKVS
ncbi:unnamed protein product [Parnassius apollo]|uniref:(apollo) hypothetical protein n=2 Tax=Parnassius apollo TaxID=110799 RepID=A0A8S3WRK8_PARAO|nr:unnamed protein product [Parnassius apollo]